MLKINIIKINSNDTTIIKNLSNSYKTILHLKKRTLKNYNIQLKANTQRKKNFMRRSKLIN